MSLSKWKREGLALGAQERAAERLPWRIGDWWNRGKAYGERVAIVTAADWTGPRYQTCRDYGWVCGRWEVSLRQDSLSFEHHKIVASYEDERALPLLAWCLETTPPRSTRELKDRIQNEGLERLEAEREARRNEQIRRAEEGLWASIQPKDDERAAFFEDIGVTEEKFLELGRDFTMEMEHTLDLKRFTKEPGKRRAFELALCAARIANLRPTSFELDTPLNHIFTTAELRLISTKNETPFDEPPTITGKAIAGPKLT